MALIFRRSDFAVQTYDSLEASLAISFACGVRGYEKVTPWMKRAQTWVAYSLGV